MSLLIASSPERSLNPFKLLPLKLLPIKVLSCYLSKSLNPFKLLPLRSDAALKLISFG